MPREHWPDRENERDVNRDAGRDRDDFGQADFSSDYYDPHARAGYRAEHDPHFRGGDHGRRQAQPRSWAESSPNRRRGPSDRVLWTVIVERLEDERRLDLRAVEVFVENAEVTLNGAVNRKEDKRRIEDIVDIEGVRHVQNNLRVRESHGWTFL